MDDLLATLLQQYGISEKPKNGLGILNGNIPQLPPRQMPAPVPPQIEFNQSPVNPGLTLDELRRQRFENRYPNIFFPKSGGGFVRG